MNAICLKSISIAAAIAIAIANSPDAQGQEAAVPPPENQSTDAHVQRKEEKPQDMPDFAALLAPQCFSSGSGATFLKVCITERGNISYLESPAGKVHLREREGYVVCSDFFFNPTVHGFDAGIAQEGWGAPTVSQPGGPGTSPFIITRNSLDGLVQLKQTFNVIPGEREVSVTMAVKNRSTVARLPEVVLDRYFDGDLNGQTANSYGATNESVWGVPVFGAARPNGLMLTQAPSAVVNFSIPGFQKFRDWSPNGDSFQFARKCGVDSLFNNTDLVGRVSTSIGDITPGQTKSVMFRYHRF
jgi:hypothetical protein